MDKMLDDFSRAKAIYDLLPLEDKKSLSLSGDTTFTNSDVVVRLCSDAGFIELFDGGDGYLYTVLAIVPAFRGKGVADVFLNFALSIVDKPVRYVSKKDNARSIGFIKKRNDFKLIEENSIVFVYEQIGRELDGQK